MSETLRCAGKTNTGLKRQHNEDNFILAPDLGVFSVADGMGGAASGEVASEIFADTVLVVFSRNAAESEKALSEQVQKVFILSNEKILNMAKESPDNKGMGCTAEVLGFYGRNYVIGHVGDSRSYLLRDGILTRLTHDHSLIQDQIDRGLISPEKAGMQRFSHVILRAVGVEEALSVDLIKGVSWPGDLFLLCSDGLTDMVSEASIREILSFPLGLKGKTERLIESANAAGGFDNITVALCEIL